MRIWFIWWTNDTDRVVLELVALSCWSPLQNSWPKPSGRTDRLDMFATGSMGVESCHVLQCWAAFWGFGPTFASISETEGSTGACKAEIFHCGLTGVLVDFSALHLLRAPSQLRKCLKLQSRISFDWSVYAVYMHIIMQFNCIQLHSTCKEHHFMLSLNFPQGLSSWPKVGSELCLQLPLAMAECLTEGSCLSHPISLVLQRAAAKEWSDPMDFLKMWTDRDARLK